MKADLVRVHHMLDATSEVLEIIGEAAVAVSSEFREKYPQIPWSGIVGMRNRLIHGYYDINLDIVWKTVKEDIPPLKVELEKIIEYEGFR